MDPCLATALGRLAGAACEARDPWWVIGSAAMALHGAEVRVRDIDLLMSRADAARLLVGHGVAAAPGEADGKFHSDVFGRWLCGGYTVEVMGGLHVHDGADWRELVPESRIAVRAGSADLFVPSLEELIGMSRLFGRPKDLDREQLLSSLLRS